MPTAERFRPTSQADCHAEPGDRQATEGDEERHEGALAGAFSRLYPLGVVYEVVRLRAVQDYYPDDFSLCYGCGRLNRDGLHVRTFWQGDRTVARFTPRPEHVALPGFVYGGLIASLIDCHGVGTAAAAVERAAGREIGDGPAPRYVTASLHVDFLKPTPHGTELELVARATEIAGRRVTVSVEVNAVGVLTARGTVIAVSLPDSMRAPGQPSR
jgi:acyl-coenzyme A thioesterase PaaI-like protein